VTVPRSGDADCDVLIATQGVLIEVKGLAAAPENAIAADLRLYWHAVLVGLQEVRHVPGVKPGSSPAASCWNA
jgi:hypothetical protein